MSSKSLFVNLKTIQDLYQTAVIADQWRIQNKDHEIHILTWEENKNIQLYFSPEIKFSFVNREKISKIKSSQVIPDFHAVNELWKNLKTITHSHWVNVFNFSNDDISGTLASVLSFDNYHGVRYSTSKNILYSNEWAKYLNEVYPANNTSINKYEILKNLIKLKTENKITAQNPYSFLEAQNALTDLKKSKGENVKIIAFDVSSMTESNLNIDEIAFKLSTTERYLPIFIHITGNVSEVPTLEKAQQTLGEDIIIIETDVAALDSVVNAVDILIARDGLAKQMAHIWKTPSLHIRKKNSNQENTGYSYLSNDLILETEEDNLVFEEVLSCVDILIFGKPQITGQWLFNDIYQIKESSLGHFKIHINPVDDSLNNIASLMTRYFFYSRIEGVEIDIRNSKIYNLFTEFEINNYLENEQNILKHSSRSLLQALRNLQEMKGKPEKISSFIMILDSFFNNDSPNFITSSVNIMFRSYLESLPEENSIELFTALENMLFELKSNYRLITTFLENIAAPARLIRKSATQNHE